MNYTSSESEIKDTPRIPISIQAIPQALLELDGDALEEFATRHSISDLEGLRDSLFGVAISALSYPDLRPHVSKTEVLAQFNSMRAAAKKLHQKIEKYQLVVQTLLFTADDHPEESRRLIRELDSALPNLVSRISASEERIKEGNFSSPYVRSKTGRPAARLDWFPELLSIFNKYSDGETMVIHNPKARAEPTKKSQSAEGKKSVARGPNRYRSKEYSGAFFEFSQEFCELVGIRIGDDALAQAIRAITEKSL